MDIPFEGGCMCGKVRYVCRSAPDTVYYCHCEDCRRGSGSAFHVGIGVSRASLHVTNGNPREWRKVADSGNGITRVFCPNCGAPLFTYLDLMPNTVMIKAGSLDDPSELEPTMEIWTKSKMPWATIGTDIKAFEQGSR